MRAFISLSAVALLTFAAPISAEPAKPADAKPAVEAASGTKAEPTYSTAETELGELLDNPVTRAIIEKIIPGFTNDDQIDMARSMTLKDIQAYAPEDVTDAKLAAIDAEFAKL